MLKKLFVVLGVSFAIAGTTSVTSLAFAPEAQAFGLGSIKKAAKKVGRGVKKGAKATGRGVKKAAKATGRGVKKGAKATGRGIKKAAKATGRGVKRAGKTVWKGAKCVAKGGCATIGDPPRRRRIRAKRVRIRTQR